MDYTKLQEYNNYIMYTHEFGILRKKMLSYLSDRMDFRKITINFE